MAADDTIKALDSFYCANVVTALWADAVANRLSGSAVFLLGSEELEEIAESARAASKKLADEKARARSHPRARAPFDLAFRVHRLSLGV